MTRGDRPDDGGGPGDGGRTGWPEPGAVRDRETGRWRGLAALALVACSVGVVATSAGLVLAGAVGLACAGYARAARPPAVDLTLTRAVDEPSGPGDEAVVTLTLRNDGDAVLPDVRVVDGIVEGVVTEGTPRFGTTLRPGEAASHAYAARIDDVPDPFRPALVRVRDASGTRERTVRVPASDGTEEENGLERRPVPAARLPRSPTTETLPGPRETTRGGDGVAFHSVRSYRRGDPPSRIDWNRFARTDELSVVEFRRPRLATVVLVVDARDAARRARAPDAPTAVDRSRVGASILARGLIDAGDRVGLTTLSSSPRWIPPGAGSDHAVRLRAALEGDGWDAGTDGDRNASVDPDRLEGRLPANALVVPFTPLCDDAAADLARRLEAGGRAVCVVSPDVTARTTAGRRLARLERERRICTLRNEGIPVLEWGADEPFETALARAGWVE